MIPGLGRSAGEGIGLPTPVFLSFPGNSDTKESTCNAGDLSSIPVLGRSPGGKHGNPLQYPCLENPHGQRSLGGYSSWGGKKSDMTERLSHFTSQVTCYMKKSQPFLSRIFLMRFSNMYFPSSIFNSP